MRNSEKKNGIKISCGYAHLHIMSFITTKFHEILLSGFRVVALTRKTWLTDWLTDGSKTLYPPQLVAWSIINIGIKSWVRSLLLIKPPISIYALIHSINVGSKLRGGGGWADKNCLPQFSMPVFCLFFCKNKVERRSYM